MKSKLFRHVAILAALIGIAAGSLERFSDAMFFIGPILLAIFITLFVWGEKVPPWRWLVSWATGEVIMLIVAGIVNYIKK